MGKIPARCHMFMIPKVVFLLQCQGSHRSFNALLFPKYAIFSGQYVPVYGLVMGIKRLIPIYLNCLKCTIMQNLSDLYILVYILNDIPAFSMSPYSKSCSTHMR